MSSWKETDINEVVSRNPLCLNRQQGLLRFSESNTVERMTFFTGTGEAIQSGGYQAPNMFGTSLDKPLFGTLNSFGIPTDLVLRVNKKQTKCSDQMQPIQITEFDGKKEQVTTFKPDQIHSKFNFYQHIARIPAVWNSRLLHMVVPESRLPEIRRELDSIKGRDFGLQYSMIRDGQSGLAYFDLAYQDTHDGQGAQAMDMLTSQVIFHGGSVSAASKHDLDVISPYLFERMAGRAGHKLMQDTKELYDPKNILNRDNLFDLTRYKQMNWLQHKRNENKHFNFYLNKFGWGI